MVVSLINYSDPLITFLFVSLRTELKIFSHFPKTCLQFMIFCSLWFQSYPVDLSFVNPESLTGVDAASTKNYY